MLRIFDMQLFVFTILLFENVIASRLSKFSVDETQTLLKEWGLHPYLGNAFKEKSYDGRFLESLEMSDFTAERAMYPQATIVHWKVLMREINAFRGVDVSDRRLEEKKTDKKPVNADGGKTDGSYKTKEEPKLDFSGFKGVEMKSDKSLVSFGKGGDVKLFRSSPGVLSVYGSLKAGQISAKKLFVGNSSIEERLSKLEAAIASLGNKEEDTEDDIKNQVRLALKKGLVYYLPLDEGKGTTTRVIGGKKGTADLRGGAAWDNGKHGSAIRLDGANDFVSAPGFTTSLSALTVCAWVKFFSTNSGGGRQYIIDFRGDGGQSNGANVYVVVDEVSKTTVKGVARFGSDGPEVITGTLPIKLNSFNHYCARRQSNGRFSYWVDAVQMKDHGTSKGTLNVQNTFRVGTYFGGSSGQYFTHGSICGVRVYNRALDESEFKSIYNTLGACDGIKPAQEKDFSEGLVYHMPLSGGSGAPKALGPAPLSGSGSFRGSAKWDGKSVNFNGNNGFISAPGFKQQLSDMTACAWAKFSSTYSKGGRQYLIDMRGDGSQNNGQNFYLIVDEVSRGKSVKGVAAFADGGEVITNAINIELGSWNHYCAVRRAGVAGGIMYFVDGKLAKTAGNNKSSKKVTAPNKFRVGTYSNGSSGQYFTHGNICGVRIYNKAMHAYDLDALFHAGPCH